MNLKGKLCAGLALAILTAMGSTAFASPVTSETGLNLVTNGSFESTSVVAGSGWTVSGFIAEGFDYFIDANSIDAQDGAHSFAGGAIGGLGFISQNIATGVGESYNIHLWLANLSGFSDNTAIEVLWGGDVVYSADSILGFSYKEIVIDPIATSAITVLSIGLQDDSFFLNVDNISVRTTSQTPEPATLALFGLGLAGLGFMRRRRLISPAY